MSSLQSPAPTAAAPLPATSKRGRWKWAAGILTIAIIAQSILWTLWWEDPTHFKMSILFVWPAALFLLTNWWIFFSGWTWGIRLGSMAAVAIAFVAFFQFYRLEWDGDMVPRRIVLRSKPTAVDVAREFFKQQTNASKSDPAEQPETNATPALVANEGDWTGFRGPHRDGIVTNGPIRTNWSAKAPREVWRHPIGRAWSAFTIIGNRAFTQEQRDEFECVVAYDLETGTQVWVHQDKELLSIVDANGGPGPHGTPEFNDGLLYTLGGTGLLNCLDAATGKSIWSINILKDAGNSNTPAKQPEWGVSNTPLIVDDLVIVIPGSSTAEKESGFNRGLAAYHKKTGERQWLAGSHAASYGSARVETFAGTRQLLVPNAKGLSGHSVETGEELWFFPLENGPQVNSAMPWKFDDDSVLFGTGYGVGSARIDIKKNGDTWEATQRWASNRFRPKFNDFIVRNGYAYGLDDGTLCCLDVESGAIKWKSGRYGYGQLLLVNDLLIVITEDGELKLISAEPKKSEPLASIKILDSGFCWNHLAVAHGRLLVRNASEAVCLDVAPDGP